MTTRQDSNSQFAEFDTSIALPYTRLPLDLSSRLYFNNLISSTIQILNREIRLGRYPHITCISCSIGYNAIIPSCNLGNNPRTVLKLSLQVNDDKQFQEIHNHLFNELRTYFKVEGVGFGKVVQVGEMCCVCIQCS